MGNKKEKLKKAFRDKDIHDGKHYSKKVASLVISAFSVLSCVLAVLLFLFIKHEMSDTDAFQLLVKENYLLSVLILIAICAVQVVVALVLEVVEVLVLAGYQMEVLQADLVPLHMGVCIRVTIVSARLMMQRAPISMEL